MLGDEGILFANPAAETIVGAPLATWQHTAGGGWPRIPKNLQLVSKGRRWLKSGKIPDLIRETFVRVDGELRHIELHCRSSEWESRRVLLITVVDITELKQAESLLLRRADELAIINEIAALSNASLDLSTILDAATKSAVRAMGGNIGVLYLYDGSEPARLQPVKFHGMSESECLLLIPIEEKKSQTLIAVREKRVVYIPDVSVIDAFPPLKQVGITSFVSIPLYSKNRALGALNVALRGQGTLHLLSEEALRSIGVQIGVAIDHAKLLKSRDQEIIERSKVEEALRASEELYRQIITTSPEAVALVDIYGNYLVANIVYAQLFGFDSSEDFLTARMNSRQQFTPESLEEMRKQTVLLYSGARMINVKGLMQRKDDSLFMAEISASLVRDASGAPHAIIGVVRDVTERQRYDEALRKSEERYRTLAEAANDMIYIIDRDDLIVYVNRYASRFFRTDPQEIVGKLRSNYFSGEAGKRQRANLEKVFNHGKPIYVETNTAFLDKEHWLGTWLAPILDQKGRVIQVLGVSRDITSYRETAMRLQASEQRFRDIIERSVDGYYFLDNDGVLRGWNQAYENILHLKFGELEGRSIFVPAGDEMSKRLAGLFARAMSGKRIPYGEIEVKLSDGETSWLSYNARRVIQKGIVIGVEGFIRDITEQKAVAEALKVSEARYRSLFDSIRYEVYGMDINGRFRETNLAFVEAWGPALGRKVSEVIKDRTVAKSYKELIKSVKETQITVQTSFSVDRAGGTVYYSAIISPVLTKEDQLIGLVGMNLDITEQVITYDSLRTISMRLVEVQEEERRRIAREIHDSLGQHLTALQFEIMAAAHALENAGDLPQALADAVGTIEESITLAQNLCYDLRPPLLDDFGLEAALRDYVTDYQEKWGIKIDFSAENLDHLHGRDAETALFRVSQEALSNVLKHAKAQNVKVRLAILEEQVLLSIQDDGCGFDMEKAKKHGRSVHYGLLTMKERIELLGGELIVKSSPGEGTMITALLPLEIGGTA